MVTQWAPEETPRAQRSHHHLLNHRHCPLANNHHHPQLRLAVIGPDLMLHDLVTAQVTGRAQKHHGHMTVNLQIQLLTSLVM